VTTSGPGLTLLYIVHSFFCAFPVSLVAAELTTAIPVEGGFYRWVRAAFGDFWIPGRLVELERSFFWAGRTAF